MIRKFAVVDGVEKEVKEFHLKNYCDFCKKELKNPSPVTFKARAMKNA